MSSPFNFKSPATSGSSGPSLFGAAGQPTGSGGGIFGNAGGTPTSTSSSTPPLFGAAPTASAQTPSLFGAQGTGASQSPFGATSNASTPSFSFGNTQNQPKSGTPATTPLFGTASATPNPLSSAAPGQSLTANDNKGTGAPPLFGSTTPGPAGGPLFGGLSTTPAGPPPLGASGGQSLFGKQTGPKPSVSFAPATTMTPTAPTSTAQPSPFGSTTPAQTPALGGLFGQAQPSGGTPLGGGTLFGAANKDKPAGQTQTPAATGATAGLFGSTTPAAPQAAGPLFGTGASGPPAPKSPFPSAQTLSAPAAIAAPSPQKPLFGATSGTPTSAPASTAAATSAPTTSAPASSMFPSPGAPKTTSAAAPTATAAPAAGNLYSLGKPATATATQATSAPTTAATATTGTTTAPATTPATSTAAPAAAPTTATGPNLGASTVGPAPPAQSRLKNKTMDEIITRWATDLTKYQKEFQEQAEQVAEWDRMLVENGTKVQKLYGNTVDAERATQEVERQLASVEGQQDELSSWLDRYEQEVETLLSKQVGLADTLQGPDQERERTYKLAEKLSERLNEMGQDLTTMIEEVNSASATLSKTTKADEPISQIVRILNSHLSQLQLIDQNTSTLRTKIAAAQRLGHQHQGQYGHYRNGSGSGVGGGGGAADDFYRAYMGKR